MVGDAQPLCSLVATAFFGRQAAAAYFTAMSFAQRAVLALGRSAGLACALRRLVMAGFCVHLYL